MIRSKEVLNENWQEFNKRHLVLKINEIQNKLQLFLQNKSKGATDKDNDRGDTIDVTRLKKNNTQTEETSISITSVTNGTNELLQNRDYGNLRDYMPSRSTSKYGYLPAIDLLSKRFSLSEFEKNLVLLCAAVELDPITSRLCAKINTGIGDLKGTYATFALGFSIFSEGHWSAIMPTGSLRRYQILNVMDSYSKGQLISNPVTINEQILHFLVGLPYCETDISAFTQISSKVIGLDTKKITRGKEIIYYTNHVSKILKTCKRRMDKNSISEHRPNNYLIQNSIPVTIFLGGHPLDGVIIAQEVCSKLGLQLRYVNTASLPSKYDELYPLIRTWTRDALLFGLGLFLSQETIAENEGQVVQTLKAFVENIPGPIFIHASSVIDMGRSYNIVRLNKPSKTEQSGVWRIFLESVFNIFGKSDETERDKMIKKLVNQFDLNSIEIFQICKDVSVDTLMYQNRKNNNDITHLFGIIWEKSLAVAKPKLGNLGVLIPPSFGENSSSKSDLSLDDLVIPTNEKELLKTIVIQTQNRDKVYREWGFQEKRRIQGHGITVLFSGQSGTGKTMAAEILSNELKLNLLKIDLSQVVSKYIGQTERNLDKIFESADKGDSVLFFDEADALFGKRTEIKDSHDRYANIETSFLLQKMESYNGLAILATNFPKALDSAFLRRIRIRVNFTFPDEASRFELWKKTFPHNTPLGQLDFNSLAKLKLTGGNIYNISINASFFAANDDKPVDMTHIKKALHMEYAKGGQNLANIEFLK